MSSKERRRDPSNSPVPVNDKTNNNNDNDSRNSNNYNKPESKSAVLPKIRSNKSGSITISVAKNARPTSASLHTKHSKKKSRSHSLRYGSRHSTPQMPRPKIDHAIRDHKVFFFHGNFTAIRRALLRRGWQEKGGPDNIQRSSSKPGTRGYVIHGGYLDGSDITQPPPSSVSGIDDFDVNYALSNCSLRHYPPKLIWTERRDTIMWEGLLEGQLINRHPNSLFTSKVGIADALRSFHWYSEPGVANTLFPRCYCLFNDEEKGAFIGDFRLTACMGLLKWVVGAFERNGERGLFDSPVTSNTAEAGRTNYGVLVTPICVDFAVRQLTNYVRLRRHEDLDWSVTPGVPSSQWDRFLSQYHSVVRLKIKFYPGRTGGSSVDLVTQAKSLYESAKRALQRIAPFWSQLNIDGTNNIWICKPGSQSRGHGIVVLNQLDKILDLLIEFRTKETNWVVQKYIERPLLIYNTKFDIRQWFVITDWSPLTVWFYKECYIRFCSKPFTVEDFHESIHLCNHAVQVRYKICSFRDSSLPEDNMWDNYTFRVYLNTLGNVGVWDSVILPGMKQGILGVLLASQENAAVRKGCFELYGADFMLCEDFHPWLIEINSGPCMASNTQVTKRMCPQCFEDLMKVVVDHQENETASTGLFQLIYKQFTDSIPRAPKSFVVHGERGPMIQGKMILKNGLEQWELPQSHTGTEMLRNKIQNKCPSALLAEGTFLSLIQRLRLKDGKQIVRKGSGSDSHKGSSSSSQGQGQGQGQGQEWKP